MQVLINNNINYLHEFKVQRPDGFCYFLDFLIVKNDKFIDLEIDGEQHLKPERILSDQKRDDFLKKDYLIYRIP
jgi:very-short-patch-repair endonuclease